MSARTGKALLAGVIGDPIAQSLSPALHEYWLREYAIDGAYIPMHVTPEHLHETLALLPKLGFKGFNATLPHKEALMDFAAEISDEARMIGAINTLVANTDGSYYGTNTDAYGFLQNLTETLKQKNHPFDFKSSSALVVGAGGAAKAILVALAMAGVKQLIVCNRNHVRAEAMITSLKKFNLFSPIDLRCIAWEDRQSSLPQPVDLLVNTTQLGMVGQPPLDINLGNVKPNGVVSDIVYNPLITPLLEQAQAKDLVTVDGLGMLLWQAQKGFELWFGVKPQITEALRTHVLASKST